MGIRLQQVQGYTMETACSILAEYIFKLKMVRVIVTPPETEKEIKLFETACNYAINAYEGQWKLKQKDPGLTFKNGKA